MSDESRVPPKITPEKNAFLRVEGDVRLVNSRGEVIKTKQRFTLCRCGHSQTKPFCDSTHKRIGWDDAKQDDRVPDKLEVYSGRELKILDNRGVCSHAGYCTSDLPDVWKMGVEPWIDPNGAPADSIVNIVRQCPSGALSYERDGTVERSYHDTPEIEVSKNGPLRVRGGVKLEGVEQGEGASKEHFTLCRCGASRNKPFCDGSHWYVGFKDDEGLSISRASRASAEQGEEWVSVGKASDFAPGKVHPVSVGPRSIALVKTDGGWCALDGKCPHQGGPLTEGTLCDGAVRCPWHGYDFALDSGKGVGNEFEVDTLDVRENEGIIEISAPAPKHSGWTFSHVIAETMVAWGVDTVFGMVGHSNLGMAEALRIQESRNRIRYIGIRHEGAAAFACSGYAKVSGKPAACLSIAGPGATNLLTGLWDAKMDRAPVLALTGQVNTQVLGPGAFQEVDLASAFAAVSRFSQTVLPGSNPAELASLALKNAVIQRDVAHLILPDEVQVLDAGSTGPGSPEGRVSATSITPARESIENSLYRIGRAKRPVIIVGYGARSAMGEIIQFGEALQCPIITTFKGKGQISDTHPLGAGVLGRSGTPVASWFMNEADLLIVFGASFAQHTGISTSKPIIQVDYDRMALAKFHAVEEPVWGDIATTARILHSDIPDYYSGEDQRPELAERWRLWRDEKRGREAQQGEHGINSAVIFRHLSDIVPEDAIISVDVGNNTYSFGRYFECKRQSIIMSGYLGSIGFGFPAAMGAWAAAPERKVVSVSGDGGFGQYMGEFMTAVKYGMNITHVLLNNAELGKISKEQRDGEWPVWQTELHNVNFAEYAAWCGGVGVRVEAVSELAAALEEGMSARGPALIEIMADPLLT